MIRGNDFSYTILRGNEKEKLLLQVIKEIEDDVQIVGTMDRTHVWEKGWQENIDAFGHNNFDADDLIPKYIRPGGIVRLNGLYVTPSDPNFQLNYVKIFRNWLFSSYLKDFDSTYEFGCGTSWNLVALAQMYPKMDIHGLDLVPSSVELIKQINSAYGLNIKGHICDMTSVDPDFSIASNSAVVTIGAIGQLAGNFESYLQLIINNPVTLCIDVTATYELYDQSVLLDYLASKFHIKRDYTKDYLTRLKELEKQGVIEILNIHRHYVGSLHMDGYSYIVWRPTISHGETGV